MTEKKKPAFERGWLKRVMNEATAEVAKWPEGMRRGVAVKPARKRKAAKPVMCWMYKSARYGLLGGAFEDRCLTFTPFVVREGKVVDDFSLVRVRIVEVRR